MTEYNFFLKIKKKVVIKVNERLKKIRKELDLSQEEFAKRLGVTGGGISKLEKGERNITEQMLKSICREFKVNYLWLTEGLGEMFMGIPTSIIDELVDCYNLTDSERQVLINYLSMTTDERKNFQEYLKKIFSIKK